MLILVALIAVGFTYLRPRHTQVEDVKVGTGPAVKTGDLVTVHYLGMLPGGKEFDSSRPRGNPLTVPAGAGQVIPKFPFSGPRPPLPSPRIGTMS
jgi:FKBP-type peptidyl-prolyl cis-trans isomerase